jgi:hypothetical protein
MEDIKKIRKMKNGRYSTTERRVRIALDIADEIEDLIEHYLSIGADESWDLVKNLRKARGAVASIGRMDLEATAKARGIDLTRKDG